MPVIVRSENIHPFLTSLGGFALIDETRALKQDIRPLEIAILNLMADKQTTERQLSRWLGHTPLQIRLTFVTTDSYIEAVRAGHAPTHTPAEHIQKFYRGWSEIRDQKFDGIVITGVNALAPRVEQEKIWDEVCEILRWSETNVMSSFFLCWGAKAALKYFHAIDSVKQDEKIWGVFEHRKGADEAGLLFGLADRFQMPVSRWKSPRRAAVEACQALEVVASSEEAGPNLLVEKGVGGVFPFPRRVYLLGHPEYDTETLRAEYERDREASGGVVPAHYFSGDDPKEPVVNGWRSSAFIYANWLMAVYGATPHDLAAIPEPWRG